MATVLQFENPYTRRRARRRRNASGQFTRARNRRRVYRRRRNFAAKGQHSLLGPIRNARPARRRRRRNPYPVTVVRRNPSRSYRLRGMFGELGHAAKSAAPVVVGIYGSRYIPRLLLREADQGATGYGANLLTTILLTGAARMMGQGRYAPLIAVGGLAAVLLRGLAEAANRYTFIPAPILNGVGIPELDMPLYRQGGMQDYLINDYMYQ